ncbi:DUF2786 domain-containing protein [Eubacterium multiforme]|uniref:DUF2786 domain-containing protein n=1 Tax=Eubacterium multiforme TaxID=83339 RepID=A0ABT9UTI1_9FIRM|nr:DUF2786 domain-containing protein [Eubacterium multiforme]MDQ0149604.1 hypothetical protein [Eubacterium multiforme]
MDNEIIIKIKKLLALSKSSNENEAKNAMLKAQQLMIKHKITIQEAENFEEINIGEETSNIKFRSIKWKANLASVIADNFGCILYYNTHSKGVHEIKFYGKEEDRIICSIMMAYAVKCIESSSIKYINELRKDRRRKHFKNIKTDYALGFINGLKVQFDKQVKSNEWGLVIVRDRKVDEMFNEFSKDFGSISVREVYKDNAKAFKKGQDEGERFSISDKIEKEDELKQII